MNSPVHIARRTSRNRGASMRARSPRSTRGPQSRGTERPILNSEIEAIMDPEARRAFALVELWLQDF